jgi:hypothetical protein
MQEEMKGDDAHLASLMDGETGERRLESGGGGLAPGGKQRDRVYLPRHMKVPNGLVFWPGVKSRWGPAQGKLGEPPVDWASQRSP